MIGEAPRTALIIEDEPKLVSLLTKYLTAGAFRVDALGNGTEAIAAVRAHVPDILLLDISLAGCDGFTVCREVRKFSDVPIIMITARVEELDKLLGLDIGADDYICKPFSPREVVARVKALMRRAQPRPPDAGSRGLRIDEERHVAQYRGHVLDLTPIEFRLLATLAASPGRVFSRQQLLDRLFTAHRIVTDRSVDSHVKNLRRKLQTADPEQEIIASIYGVGYKFDL